jgi:hypothetical protein
MKPSSSFFDLIVGDFVAPTDGAEIRASPFNRKSRDGGKNHASREALVMFMSARLRVFLFRFANVSCVSRACRRSQEMDGIRNLSREPRGVRHCGKRRLHTRKRGIARMRAGVTLRR